MRSSMTWVVIASLVACGGHESETTPEPGAAGGAQGEATPSVRPCDAYVGAGLRCAAEQAAAMGWGWGPTELDGLEQDLRERCRGWFEAGATRVEVEGAVTGCAAVSCSDGANAWDSCIVQAVPAAAVAHAGAPSSPEEWTHIAPRPIPSDTPVCEVFVGWVLECTSATLGESGATPAVAAALRDAFAETCEAWRESGIDRLLGGAMQACADVACGAGGADLLTCITTAIADAATREVM